MVFLYSELDKSAVYARFEHDYPTIHQAKRNSVSDHRDRRGNRDTDPETCPPENIQQSSAGPGNCSGNKTNSIIIKRAFWPQTSARQCNLGES